jgi:hypothetical protein
LSRNVFLTHAEGGVILKIKMMVVVIMTSDFGDDDVEESNS